MLEGVLRLHCQSLQEQPMPNGIYRRLAAMVFCVLFSSISWASLITITEHSSTSLTVGISDGSIDFVVTNVQPDVWTVDMFVPATAVPVVLADFTGSFGATWNEPRGLRNFVSFHDIFLRVESDVAFQTTIELNDGDTCSCLLRVSDGAIVDLRFIDEGDASSVPEPSGVALLCVGLAGLAWSRRTRS